VGKGIDSGVSTVSFSEIARRYERDSRVQAPAAEILIGLLGIDQREDVLDLGCGTGQLTRRIREMTSGRAVGVDASEGMIREAVEKSKGLDIGFETRRAEELEYRDAFDVIFCNSAFQWFKNPEPVLVNCRRALRKGGRMGIQAPARTVYCPNFIRAVEQVAHDPRTRETFASFRSPWFFLETAEEYASLFERAGFTVAFSRIDPVKSSHPPEEVLKIFDSGAAAGYLNRDFYAVPIDDAYVEAARQIIESAFHDQANEAGLVELVFHRIYLVATKE
jgi:ubiquinone/menaquinone biosynthesis C-methylase UbiE